MAGAAGVAADAGVAAAASDSCRALRAVAVALAAVVTPGSDTALRGDGGCAKACAAQLRASRAAWVKPATSPSAAGAGRCRAVTIRHTASSSAAPPDATASADLRRIVGICLRSPSAAGRSRSVNSVFLCAEEERAMEVGGPPSQCRGLSSKSHRYRLPPVNGGCIVCPPHAERSYAASRLIGLAAALAVLRPAHAFSAAPAPAPVRAFATASAPMRIACRAQPCVDAPRRRPRRTHPMRGVMAARGAADTSRVTPVTLLSCNAMPRRRQDASEFLHQWIVPLRGANASRSAAAKGVCTPPQ